MLNATLYDRQLFQKTRKKDKLLLYNIYRCRPWLISTKDEFIVVIPTTLFGVDARFQVGRRNGAGCAGGAAAGQVKSLVLQHVECLFDGGVFQVKTSCVAVRLAVVRISTFI